MKDYGYEYEFSIIKRENGYFLEIKYEKELWTRIWNIIKDDVEIFETSNAWGANIRQKFFRYRNTDEKLLSTIVNVVTNDVSLIDNINRRPFYLYDSGIEFNLAIFRIVPEQNIGKYVVSKAKIPNYCIIPKYKIADFARVLKIIIQYLMNSKVAVEYSFRVKVIK